MKHNLPAALCWLTVISAKSIILNSKNFASSIKKGTWFVKFYAPWCKYSKRLAPEWVLLSNTLDHLENKGFYFGEVDCNSNGNTCTKNSIDGYPTLKLFHNGKYIEEFDQDAVPELTATYISPYAVNKAKKYFKRPIVKVDSSKASKEPIVEIDPPKAIMEPMDSGFVVDIDPSGFNSTYMSSNPWTVLFYSPTCPHCKALEPLYIDVALKSKNRMNFAKLDCIEYGEFCQEKQVKGVPDMRIFLQGKQLDKRVGGLPLTKLLKFVHKYYIPKTIKKTLQEVDSFTLKAISTASKPFMVLASDSKSAASEFKSILSKLIGAGLKGEIILVEDEMASETLKLKSPVSMFSVINSKVVEFTHLLGSADTFRAWAASVDFPLSSELQAQTFSELDLEDYYIIVSMYTKPASDVSLAKLKEITLQSNIYFLQTLAQNPALTSLPLIKPTIFTYISGSIESEFQKQLLSKLKVPFGELQKHAQKEASDSLFLLIDSSAHKFYYLNSTREDRFSSEVVSSSIRNFQLAKLEAHPLIEYKSSSYVFYILAPVLFVGILVWYRKKSKREQKISYHRL